MMQVGKKNRGTNNTTSIEQYFERDCGIVVKNMESNCLDWNPRSNTTYLTSYITYVVFISNYYSDE